MSLKKKVFASAAAVVLVFAALSSVVVTQENEYTLIRQFGKIRRVEQEAGVSFRIPFLQSVSVLPRQALLYDLTPSDVITSDKKTMISDSYVIWRITDPVKFAQTLNSSVSSAESRINTSVYNAAKNVISSMPQDQVISERNNIAATYTAEGDSEAKVIRNTTDKEVAIQISDAEKQGEILKAEGEAEYMRILAEAYSDEEKTDFYSYVRSLDALKESMSGENKTVVLPADSPIAQIFGG